MSDISYHTSHRQHPVNSLKCQVPDYADKKCLLCAKNFDKQHHQLHHCDVCNLSICRACMKDPPPVHVECLKTHEHQLHLVPRRINFTCNACGTQGDRSPYFCLPCNYMIHRECIDLPRVININRHDHHISYTPRLGHGEWKCKVCHEKIDGFYGAYTVGIVKAHVQLFIIRLGTWSNRKGHLKKGSLHHSRYESAPYMTLDIRCASSSDKRVHGSHPNPLYYYSNYSHNLKSRVEIVYAEQVVGLYARQAVMTLRDVLACSACTAPVKLVAEGRPSKHEDMMVAAACLWLTKSMIVIRSM
ncbi:hypothetical protein DY000_02020321 [Brassica cretica]|uniref:DC1 domain-containing protein n=1 Tax=Brassica cretica TaxID=69181 RepID=A0ABQ7DYS2_BRACR|nr:hypothetical protein DY000_02020321 [Brassica cretica]